MIEMLGQIAWKSLGKLCGILLNNLLGWVYLLVLFLIDYFAGHAFIVCLAMAVTLMDAVWGIAVSIRQGQFALSELARLTIAKLAVYGCALSVFVGLDKVTDSVVTGSVVGAAIVLVEFWSCCASMLILFPHILFLRLMKKALTGEIASKLHISEDDVVNVLEGRNNNETNDDK